MMNKKIIALVVTIMTTTGLFADECYRRGRRVDCDRGVVRTVGEGTVDTADTIVTGTLGSGSILNPGNWGESGREKREAAKQAREDRRANRY